MTEQGAARCKKQHVHAITAKGGCVTPLLDCAGHEDVAAGHQSEIIQRGANHDKRDAGLRVLERTRKRANEIKFMECRPRCHDAAAAFPRCPAERAFCLVGDDHAGAPT